MHERLKLVPPHTNRANGAVKSPPQPASESARNLICAARVFGKARSRRMCGIIGYHEGMEPIGATRIGRFSEMERRYRLRCPECRNHFWIARRLIKTSVFDGGVKGFECPHKGCGAIVPWRDAS